MQTLSERFIRETGKWGKSHLSSEEILGPNWQTLFHFWLYVDSLDYEGIALINQSFIDKYGPYFYDDFSRQGVICDNVLWETLSDFIRERYQGTSLDDGHSWYHFLLASREIVKMHQIFDSGESLKYLPLCVVQ